jgi:hypothetical protein
MKKPAFKQAWQASQKIFSPVNSGERVAKVIGGTVATNINNPDEKYRWKNTCAVRMSYIMNHSGMTFPAIPKKTVSGADGKQYFFRVPDLIEFFTLRFGKPDLILAFPASGKTLANKKGIIMFEVQGWLDAKGHATLWNGDSCYDHCYFDVSTQKVRTPRANFWSLP